MTEVTVSRRGAAQQRSSSPAKKRAKRQDAASGKAPAKASTPWLFLAPYLVFFICFVLGPAIFGIYVSLFDWHFTLPNKPFVGLQNYINLFTPDSRDFSGFWKSMGATGLFIVISVPLLVTVPLGIALLINRNFKGRTFFRAVYFAPHVLGVAVVGVLWKYILDTQYGILNRMLGLDIPWLQQLPWAWISIVVATLWWTLGFNAIIYLAGLQGIPAELYEAAALDGAGPWAKFRYVTLPGLRTVFTFVLVMTVLASANLFGQPYIMTDGAPDGATKTAIMYMSETGLKQFRMGAASAMSYILAIGLLVISVLNFKLTAKKDD